MNKIDWLSLDGKTLRVFMTVLDAGTITGAAEKLGITQSAVSHTVEKLREIVGDPLFIRAGRTITPTTYALEMAKKVEIIIANLEDLVQKPSFVPMESDVDIVIAANDFQSSLLMPRFNEQVKQKLKSFKLNIISPYLPTVDLLRENKCDLAIVGFRPESADIMQKTLFDMNTVVFYDPATRKAPEDMADFLTSEHIEVSFLKNFKSGLDDTLKEMGKYRKVSIYVPNFSSIASFLRGTNMLATVPAQMILTEMKDFATCPLPFKFTSGKMNMIWHQSHQEDLKHKWLRNEMIKVVSSLPAMG